MRSFIVLFALLGLFAVAYSAAVPIAAKAVRTAKHVKNYKLIVSKRTGGDERHSSHEEQKVFADRLYIAPMNKKIETVRRTGNGDDTDSDTDDGNDSVGTTDEDNSGDSTSASDTDDD